MHFSDETFEGREPKAGWAPEDPEWSPGDDIMQRIAFILESHIPFVGEETPEMGSQILKGNIGSATALAAGEFFGGKSAPFSYTDYKQIISKEKLEEETEGKISHGFSGIGGILARPNRQAQKHSKRPEGTWLRKNISPKQKMNERVRG